MTAIEAYGNMSIQDMSSNDMSIKNISSNKSIAQQNVVGDNIAKRHDEKIYSDDGNHVLYAVSGH